MSAGVACGVCKRRQSPLLMLLLEMLQEVGLLWPFLQALHSICTNPYITANFKSSENAAITSRLFTDIVNDWLLYCILKKVRVVWKRSMARLIKYTVAMLRHGREARKATPHVLHLLHLAQYFKWWGTETVRDLSKHHFYTVQIPASHHVISKKQIRLAELECLNDSIQIRQLGSNIWVRPFNHYAL